MVKLIDIESRLLSLQGPGEGVKGISVNSYRVSVLQDGKALWKWTMVVAVQHYECT